ncbi:SPW repeat domain-containing protein [Halopiger thermotolerans]
MSTTVEWLAGVNAILGAWVIATPFVFTDAAALWTGSAFWNYVLVGGAIVSVSGYNWWITDDDDAGSELAATGSVVLGLWLIVFPLVTDVGVEGPFVWIDMAVGATIAKLAAYNIWLTLSDKSVTWTTRV